jgi:preprotein translocase subunit SecE
VAKETRSERRAKRAAREQSSTAQRAQARSAAVRPGAQPVKSQGGGRRVPGGGTKRFISESYAELKKVDWPTQHQLMTGTAVVIIACVIVGTYLWANDLLWKHVVKGVLLR